MRYNYAIYTYLSCCSIYLLSFDSVYVLLSAPSVEMDGGSLGDSDGIKDPGSKKRYTILFYLSFLIKHVS
jgi:hypothetical protein